MSAVNPAELVQVLTAVQNPTQHVRVPAEHKLQEWETSQFPHYFQALLDILANPNHTPAVRMMSGLMLKNTLVAKERQRRAHNEHRWLMLPIEHRQALKNKIIATLSSAVREARHLAAVLVGNVAAIEIPKNQWEDLVPSLVHNIQTTRDVSLKESTLETLGYVCEECPDQLHGQSGNILNVISTCIGDQSIAIRMAATKALANSLEFARDNMAVPAERNLIMQMIFSSLQCNDTGVRLHGFSCLVKMASIYYQYLAEYLSSIFEFSKSVILQDDENVAMQAIEFWSSICDAEIELKHIHADAQSKGKPCNEVMLNVIPQVLPVLCPILLQCMTKQSEYRDSDTWDRSAAAAICLTLCSEVASNEIVGHVLPFVEQNIHNPDWHFKEAATLAFGCILDGPPITTIQPLVTAAFIVILQHIKDSNEQVRDSASWTIGRMCELVPHQTLSDAHIQALMQAILFGLAQDPRMASLMCWSIRSIILKSAGPQKVADNRFTAYFKPLMQALLTCSQRKDADESNLKSSAVEALNVIIQYSPADASPLIEELYSIIKYQLEQSFQQVGLSQDESLRIRETQALLCASLQVIINKRSYKMTIEEADTLMMLFLNALQNPNVTLFEEALMAIGCIANITGEQFIKYMESTAPFIGKALRNTEDYHLNRIAVGLISDLSRSLGSSIAPFCDDILTMFLQNLQSDLLDTTVKPHIIAAIGDIAMALNEHFMRYLTFVMQILVEASALPIDPSDLDSIENINQLRTSILETYTAAINALAVGNQANAVLPFAQAMLGLLERVASDPESSPDALAAASGMCGDLASCLGGEIGSALAHPCIKELLQRSLGSGDPLAAEQAQWAQSVLSKLPIAM